MTGAKVGKKMRACIIEMHTESKTKEKMQDKGKLNSPNPSYTNTQCRIPEAIIAPKSDTQLLGCDILYYISILCTSLIPLVISYPAPTNRKSLF